MTVDLAPDLLPVRASENHWVQARELASQFGRRLSGSRVGRRERPEKGRAGVGSDVGGRRRSGDPGRGRGTHLRALRFRKPIGQGNGLGLAISRQLVEGFVVVGSAWRGSRPERGSRLPSLRKRSTSLRQVLIVDDENGERLKHALAELRREPAARRRGFTGRTPSRSRSPLRPGAGRSPAR